VAPGYIGYILVAIDPDHCVDPGIFKGLFDEVFWRVNKFKYFLHT